jgi:hypothetical protein
MTPSLSVEISTTYTLWFIIPDSIIYMLVNTGNNTGNSMSWGNWWWGDRHETWINQRSSLILTPGFLLSLWTFDNSTLAWYSYQVYSYPPPRPPCTRRRFDTYGICQACTVSVESTSSALGVIHGWIIIYLAYQNTPGTTPWFTPINDRSHKLNTYYIVRPRDLKTK